MHEGVRYPCHQCDFNATQRGDLMRHIKSQHEGLRFLCDQCDYMATTKGHLMSHIKRKHCIKKKELERKLERKLEENLNRESIINEPPFNS